MKHRKISRPQSIIVLATLQLISGIVSLVQGLFVLSSAGFFGDLNAAIGASGLGAAIAYIIGIAAVISLILGMISLAAAWGLFQLKSWAWMVTAIACTMYIISQFARIFSFGGINFLTVGLAVVSFYYLMRSDVKQIFLNS
ncbi:MAG: hypothetical protein ACRC62_06305 [Microcoleus sp.]